MYNIYTTKVEDIAKRIKSTGNFNSISKKQKNIFINAVENIQIINAREVFIFSFIFLVWYKTCISCIITLKTGEKFVIDLSKKKYKYLFFKIYLILGAENGFDRVVKNFKSAGMIYLTNQT